MVRLHKSRGSISIQIESYHNEDLTLQSPASKRGGWNIYGDCTFATSLPNIRANHRGGVSDGKKAIEGFIACMIERGEEVPVETMIQ